MRDGIWSYERQCKEYDLDQSEDRNLRAHQKVANQTIDLAFKLVVRLFTFGQDEEFIRLEQAARRALNKLTVMNEWADLYGHRW